MVARVVRRLLLHWPFGRWNAIAGILIGVAFFAQRLAATHDSLLRAFLGACGAAFALVVVVGVIQRFWIGGKVESASAPGGWSVGFGATRKALGELNSRVDDQMKLLNERLFDLEKVVFKGENSNDDQTGEEGTGSIS